jgi:hypothetical protein
MIMLVEVFTGASLHSARSRGTFHFAAPPKAGEQVEIDAEVLTVTRAWHRPTITYRDAKFAILAHEEVARPKSAVRPDAEPVS